MFRIIKRPSVPTLFVVIAFQVFLFAAIGLAQSGTLDPTFGDGGVASVSGQLGSAGSSAIQSDGKFLVLSSNPSFGARLVRFNADGSLDQGFGTGGVVSLFWPSTTNGQYGWAYDVAVQNISGTDRIVLAGYAAVQSRNKLVEGTRVDRLLLNGSIDTSFGNQGSVAFAGANATEQSASNLAIQSDQKIVLSSWNTIYRFNANGSTDSSFGSGGKVSTVITGSTIAIQSDGKLVVGGYVTSKNKTIAAVSRHNANGSVDTSFGASGKTMVNLGGGRIADVVLAPNGDIYVGGAFISSPGINAATARFNSFGQLDPAYGSGGITTFDSGANVNDYCWRIGLQPDGKVLCVGNTVSDPGPDLLTVRFDTAGNPDPSFGTLGGSILDLFGSPGGETARGVFVQNLGTPESPDYRIVVAGSGSVPGTQYSFAVRLNY